MCKRPFYDLLPTIECDTPRTVQCRLAVNPGMQICRCTKRGSYYLEKVLNCSNNNSSSVCNLYSLVLDGLVLISFIDPNDFNPLFDVKEFRNAPFQRVYQYLKLSSQGKSLDNFTFKPGNIDDDQRTCLMLLLRYVKLML